MRGLVLLRRRLRRLALLKALLRGRLLLLETRLLHLLGRFRHLFSVRASVLASFASRPLNLLLQRLGLGIQLRLSFGKLRHLRPLCGGHLRGRLVLRFCRGDFGLFGHSLLLLRQTVGFVRKLREVGARLLFADHPLKLLAGLVLFFRRAGQLRRTVCGLLLRTLNLVGSGGHLLGGERFKALLCRLTALELLLGPDAVLPHLIGGLLHSPIQVGSVLRDAPLSPLRLRQFLRICRGLARRVQ